MELRSSFRSVRVVLSIMIRVGGWEFGLILRIFELYQFWIMEAEQYAKTPPTKQQAMQMRRVSLIMRPLPTAEMTKQSEKSLEPQTFRNKTLEAMNGLTYNIIITLITFYVLLADDLRQIFFPPSADLPFTIINVILMSFYIIDICVSCYARDGYFFSFFFWLDVVSTGTMVFDLMWINVGGSAGVATNIVQIARAGKAARIGARSARMIRLVKLIKMVQEYKAAKMEMTSEHKKEIDGIIDGIQKKANDTHDRFDRRRGVAVRESSCAQKAPFESPEVIHQEMMRRAQDRKSTKDLKMQTYSEIVDLKETRVGIKLKEEMEKNSTLMILLVLISVPLLSASTWFQEISIYESSLGQMNYFYKNGSDVYTISGELQIFISQSLQLNNPMVYLDFPVNTTCCNFPRDFQSMSIGVPSLESLRASSTVTHELGDVSVTYNTTDYDIFMSQLNIGRTLFVSVLLIISSLVFSQGVEEYLLEPLESMLVTVKRISSDPLKAIIALENENLIKSTIKSEDDKKEGIMTQPTILENMIIKIGSLLVVGFGEAGSEIIVKNIEAYGAINPVLSGTKMIAIFGFCDIRNFTDATEVLQTGVMNFVNDIAEIVHGTVNKCGGSANKNIGDAFLLVWKFKQKQVFLSENNGRTEITLRKIKKVSQIADLAVYSFMKIVAELSKASKLLKYTNNAALCERIKNFTGVKMGFGLHVGWAIEGAIGSQFKIDASYLSPNVNMASRLQAATKQFGVFMLISGDVVQLMTPINRNLMRLIDRVTVKGSIEPIDLYTLDISTQHFIDQNSQNKLEEHTLTTLEKKKLKMFAHKNREAILTNIEAGKSVTERIFTNDKDFEKMREPYSESFMQEWGRGYDLYLKGEWQEARVAFKNTLRVNDSITDGPSHTMLEVLESHQNVAPPTWQGFRELTQK